MNKAAAIFVTLFCLVGPFGVLGQEAASERDKPSFDIVRVSRDGIAVMAGRAPADTEIRILDSGRVLATTRPNDSGEWVAIVDGGLTPGSREYQLIALTSDGREIPSDESVLILVPEPTGLPKPPTIDSARLTDPPTRPPVDDEQLETGKQPAPVALILTKKPGGLTRLTQRSQPAKGLSLSELSINKVDYDERGRFAVSGSGSHGSLIMLYLDNAPVGQQYIADGNRWTMQTTFASELREHNIRVDQIVDGEVVARVEVPFYPSKFAEAAEVEFAKTVTTKSAERIGGTQNVVVKPGENLWQIARRVYGEGTKYTIIYRANKTQLRNTEKIYPGQILTVPRE